MGAGNRTPVFCKNSKCFQPLSHLSKPQVFKIFYPGFSYITQGGFNSRQSCLSLSSARVTLVDQTPSPELGERGCLELSLGFIEISPLSPLPQLKELV